MIGIRRIGITSVLGLLALLLAGCQGGSEASRGFSPYSSYEGTSLDGPAPDFRLVDQKGAAMALSDFRGKVVVLAFLDSECTDSCPLTANEFRLTSGALGADAARVAFLAVNVNPKKNSVADVAAATKKWGVQDLAGWHYLTGSREELTPIYPAYGILAEGPPKPDKPGELEHSPGAYLIDQVGKERWYISTNFEGAPLLSVLLVKHVRQLLR